MSNYDTYTLAGEDVRLERRKNPVIASMKYEIVAKKFDDATVAGLYAYGHLTVMTLNGPVIENRNADGDVVDYTVLELVAA